MLLIYHSVIMILSFVKSSEIGDINDLSDLCLYGRVMHYYLTSGTGLSDKSVAMVATENKLNCTLNYLAKSQRNIIVVLEFPDLKPHESLCIAEKNTSLTVSDIKEKQVCQPIGPKFIISKISKETVSVHIRSAGEVGTIKITATSMRDALEQKCSHESETECIINKKIFCMTYKAVCDGHNNCGVDGSYDEDERKCKGLELSFLMIICTLVMSVVTLFLFISIWMTLLPKPKETFVYKFDQTLSLFDSQSGITSAEIDIKILFTKETQT